MNKDRRKEVKSIYAALQEVKEHLEDVLEEEQDSYDNIPENLQDTQAAYDSGEAIDNLDDAIECCSEALEYLEEVI